MNLRQRAHDLYYAYFNEAIKEARGMKSSYTQFELSAAMAVGKALGIPITELEFRNSEDFFEEVKNQLNNDFERSLVVKTKNDDTLFLYGLTKEYLDYKEGLWEIGSCPCCEVVTVCGEPIKSLFQFGQPGKSPWWHKNDCSVITPSIPCH
ncbi:MAG: hypothetical protein A3B86_03375 [Candidatus Yanofskybacteria bacterium RIFCSPHIGHO2_02_FULL_38_22b]|uniref:Uncharacterized protein n=1 Tax=Candidatus Yanofskybacteria bacterium RIFCSPHIGHO2_02_FULL_38_22b TaxID=1802673 RepID=A0A1F8F031_9BACT|nr:MAG: hypothetical protein A3B86_03375 [Candidatus Yanofskybacteria bacterium RIFCSPHIGHO2_02_FULL_38_22b]OGN19428.1 MAG: hypothetical protein A2910_02755 [Candidatus Yanofskybacteria bacterium RIFCSPLOWO2_01_FULL_39_28]